MIECYIRAVVLSLHKDGVLDLQGRESIHDSHDIDQVITFNLSQRRLKMPFIL